jgi:hypothetical protein
LTIFYYIQHIYLYTNDIMKKLHTSNIFDLFTIQDDFADQPIHHTSVYHSDFIVIVSVIKQIENFYLLEQILRNRYDNIPHEQFNDVQLNYFTTAIRPLLSIDDIEHSTIQMVIHEFGTHHVCNILQKAIQVFVEHECYEICSKINKIITLFSVK